MCSALQQIAELGHTIMNYAAYREQYLSRCNWRGCTAAVLLLKQ
jgi:hypothetical protein